MIKNIITNLTITMYVFVALIVIGILVFFLVKHNLQSTAKATKGRGVIPRHDYSRFNRADARDFIQFDDIINVGDPKTGFGIYVDDNFHRFVCYLSIQGYDYAMATEGEKYSTAMNMIGVINCITNQIQIRQDARPADFSEARGECDRIIEDSREKIQQVNARISTLLLRLNTIIHISKPSEEDVEMARTIDLQLEDCKQEIAALEWIIAEQEIIKVQYVANTDIHAEHNPERNVQYIIDWIYNENEHLNKALTREEIRKEAINKLWVRSGAFITALGKCGVYARRMNANEILETLRYHTHPYSTSQYATEHLIRDYSFKNLFSTSDFPETMKMAADKEERENEELQRNIENYYRQLGVEIPEDAPEIIYGDDNDDKDGEGAI